MNTAETRRAAFRSHRARMAALKEAARSIVATGTCPDCGAPLIRNNSLAGWWQCAAYATPAFRALKYRALPACHFQTFTE
jgi:hypothetical protein